ncbi:CPBP family glutamic-type intramembrane protease [Citricoccus sp. NR2]|uniref:CPBP family glutamic-type intramembrane protease n=1 Tax=Citricoccus sp. NR2 TaxID=3004095 RepID=UPI0022DD28FB|nr:CPBP family glutamic-type intramembrane protease [Citricoccus sp. NR2]WBL18831.1 CPBP family glutamic-type intramembrane protease [Citricoccus sp. NR2]
MTATESAPHPADTLRYPSRAVVWWEIIIVLALSLGRSGVYAVVDLMQNAMTAPLRDQTTTLNPSLANEELFDLIRQLLSIGFSLVPVLLVCHLVWIYGRNPFRTFGLDFRRFWTDAGLGVTLFVVMGAGTLGVYALGRTLGLTTALVGSAMNEYWWTTPVLVLSALRHSLLEEVIVLAWLLDRIGYLQQLRGTPTARPKTFHTTATGAFRPGPAAGLVAAVAVSALVRASYHLYQGIGPGVGNLIMGVVFAVVYLRYRRVMPFVYAHLLLDVAGFAGYPLLLRLGWFGG